MTYSLIALGSNLGERRQQLQQATAKLAHLPRTQLLARSRWHETPPIGGPAGQGSFLNAAALLSTELGPAELLAALRGVEVRLGRERTERWAARLLDLDLLLYDATVMQTPELAIPHPRMAYRRFVLEPAAEIAAWMVHPESGWTVGGLLHHLNRSSEFVAVAAASDVAEKLVAEIAQRLQLPVFGQGNDPRHGEPVVMRWLAGAGDVPLRPKLLLAAGGSAGTPTHAVRKMLCLPATGPIAWVNADAGSTDEAVAAVQAVWPALAK